jgi:aminoglycoside 3-N-acetyltransferase
VGFGKEDLLRDLVKIGVEEGDCLALGVSLRSIGWVDGGANTLVDALLEAVGGDGTIMIPTFTRSFPLPLSRSPKGGGLRVRWGGIVPSEYVFDPSLTPPITGAVANAIWRRPKSMRSRHPTNSVGAIGRSARDLVDGHGPDDHPLLPYERLVQLGGKGLFIGLNGRLVALRHLAQYDAGLMNILPPRSGVRYRREDGSIALYVRKEMACVDALPQLNPQMVGAGVLRKGTLGRAESLVADARGVVDHLSQILRQRPEANLCNDFTCLWCRELERRLDLYGRIAEPRIYQRSRVLRQLTAMANARRMEHSGWAARLVKMTAVLMDAADGQPSRRIHSRRSRA